jgi:hypothetical protein
MADVGRPKYCLTELSNSDNFEQRSAYDSESLAIGCPHDLRCTLALLGDAADRLVATPVAGILTPIVQKLLF